MTAPSALPLSWLDRVLLSLVLGLGFLVASFPARNSDLWQHLATGRLLAAGEFAFGPDPFAYTTEDITWVDHAWLFDLALYLTYSSFGGPALVLCKALGVGLLAVVLLRFRRGDGSPSIVALCVLLALIAMSPRLLVQPVVASLLMLALCLNRLHRGGRAAWAVPPLIALWVNLDAWFVLGPLLVVVFWLGRPPADRRIPALVVPASLLACLMSPYHVRALALPSELSWSVWHSALRDDVRFAPLFASSWQGLPGELLVEVNLASWALVFLFALSLLSFLHRPAWRDWRLPVWLLFAVGAVWQVRLVPFFAVVAAPIAALNLQGMLAGRSAPWPIRLGLISGCLALIALCWPGWIQGGARQDRALSWEIQADPSLVGVAETVRRWRAEGTLEPSTRTFATHPDVAHYLAWFAPGERSFLDARFPLFTGVSTEHEHLCRLLLPNIAPDRNGSPILDGLDALRKRHIGCVILHDPNRGRLGQGLRQATLMPDRWQLLRVDGRTLLVGFREVAPHLDGIDPTRLAFAPGEAIPPVPEAGPSSILEEMPWWQRWLERPGRQPSSREAEAAALYLRLFEDGASSQLRDQRTLVVSRFAAALVGLPASSDLSSNIGLAIVLTQPNLSLPDLQQRPAALPLLSLRSARRGLASQPDDSRAWLVLGQTYLQLGRVTAEGTPRAALPLLNMVRYIQAVNALHTALALDPDSRSAHEELAGLYAGRGYFDLAHRHGVAELRLLRRQAMGQKEQIDHIAALVEGLEREVQNRTNRFAVQTESLSDDPFARARIALSLGLAGKALDDVLLKSRAELFGVEGACLQLELLLVTGRAEEARRLLDEAPLVDNPAGLGFYQLPGGPGWGYRLPAYEWFEVCIGAATGRYDRAHSASRRIQGRLAPQADRSLNVLRSRANPSLASEVGLAGVAGGWFGRLIALELRGELDSVFTASVLLSVELGDLDVISAMLLLEQGDPIQARAFLERALGRYRSVEALAPNLPGRPLALHYLGQLDLVRRVPTGERP